MVRLSMDVHGLVIWFPVRVVLAVVQVEGDVEEVRDLEVTADGDFEVELLECFRHVFPDAIGFTAGYVFEDITLKLDNGNLLFLDNIQKVILNNFTCLNSFVHNHHSFNKGMLLTFITFIVVMNFDYFESLSYKKR